MKDITESDISQHQSFAAGLAGLDLSEEVFPYDINANAHAYEAETTYSHDMLSDAYWRGPVKMPAKSTAMSTRCTGARHVIHCIFYRCSLAMSSTKRSTALAESFSSHVITS
jgi:hypothetical protein